MTIIGYLVVGLIAGTVSAALGIGGGVIFVPALVILFSVDQHIAQGTSLAVIVPTAVIGAWAHARAGRVVWRYSVPLGFAGIVGGIIGGWIALSLDDVLLRRMFATMLVFTAFRMLRVSRAG